MITNFKHKTQYILTALVFVAGFLSTLNVMAQTMILSSKLEVVKPKAYAHERVDVRFIVTNNSPDPVHVLKWLTPLEPFNSEVFLVTKNGKPIEYIGRLVKRGAPTEKDYITIQPNESVSNTLDISEAYAITEIGDYQIQLRTDVIKFNISTTTSSSLMKTDEPHYLFSLPLTTESVTIEVTEQRKLSKHETTKSSAPGVPTFHNCSGNQKNTLLQATTGARSISKVARDSLIHTSIVQYPKPRRYVTWFGTAIHSRYNTVTRNFNKINDALETKNLAFHCDCNDPDVFAYVYPNQPYKIWLCGAFWPAPLMGTDSQSGTLVHEVSHFNIVARTADLAYGQAACKQLAKNDPNGAIRNADSYEYYAENNPPIPMP